MLDLAKLSVLLVEDEPDFRLLASEMLRSFGICDPVVVGTPLEALSRLQQMPFDVLVSDLRLGSESGMRLIQQAKTISPQTRAILMSAYATGHDVQEATSLGALAVLNKPFLPDQLELALRRAAAAADGLWGEVHDLSLIDMLQMYHYGRRSVTVSISGPINGRISMQEGEIVDAEAGKLRGLAALRELLPAKTGVVRTEAAMEISRPSIEDEFESVMLDCLRLIDEAGQGAHGASSLEMLDHDLESAFAGLGPELAFETRAADRGVVPEVGSTGRESNHELGGPGRTTTSTTTRGEGTMATEKQLQETLTKIQGEITGFIGASVVDLDTGMTLAVHSARADFDLSTASAYNSEMVKMKLKTMKTLNLKSTLEDMLLTLSDQIHLIKLITPTTFLYLAADKGSTNLAIVRSVVAKQVAGLQ